VEPSPGARGAFSKALEHLFAPIAGLENLGQSSGRTWSVGGGCFFWIIFGWLAITWLLFKWSMICAYVAMVLALRLLAVLVTGIAVGILNGSEAIDRWRERRRA